MILKRQEKENIVTVLYDSSNILASIYDNTTNELNLIFKGGRKYKYPNVSKSDYMRFEIAESQGNVFNTHIKKYASERLEDVDPTKIIIEAETLKAEEDKALIEGKRVELIKSLKIVALSEDITSITGEVFYKSLENLKTLITDFLSLVNKSNNEVSDNRE